MEKKFKLKQMLEEIREDEAATETRHTLLSPDGVKQRVARRQKARRIQRRNV
jgi:hypothetical protein